MATDSTMVLSNLGISWDGKAERPVIIEAFKPTLGRTALAASGAIALGALPDSSDLSFYDYATKGTSATQANYANNRYFPRATPSRCPAGTATCPSTETAGLAVLSRGDWRTGGTTPDLTESERLHEDGDVHAGNSSSGGPLPDATGAGIPYPGAKGYRTLNNWTLQYANLGAWFTQDTVEIVEWTTPAPGNEHNQNRRGMVAFGDVTNPAAVPSAGTAVYSGTLHGWYGTNPANEPALIRADVTVTVNFATREVAVDVANSLLEDSAGTTVPLAFKATVGAGAAGSNVANYMTGPVTVGALKGGLGGRFFGPVVQGGSGAGPAEIGFTFTVTDAASGASVLAGFVGRKQ
ncbi:HupA family protein [Noviherbaspirillum galbum]|uniref:Transferrin-binding protein B C-lobe/N-lobe beta barrel domain-containing protein n=1 Tax=Noviherbaspirillum galbum TaxID=2709383 RepID=A0A6B3SX41_9BURK|nr:hypothetical protein [Noviherbaspirillum galbum]NEX64085.1 hypothetical protein [Noviherbaspirillum galbum]